MLKYLLEEKNIEDTTKSFTEQVNKYSTQT